MVCQVVDVKKCARERFAPFLEDCSDLFAAHPDLMSFGWRQYPPLFRGDGPYHFSVFCWEPDINGIEGPDIQEGTVEEKLQGVVTKFLSDLSDELEEIFGDGRVTVFRDGTVKREQCDHE